MPDDDDPLLDYAAIAALTGLSVSTLRAYVTGGYFPPADKRLAPDRPRWRRSTVTTWQASRPGRGAPGKPRSRRAK